MNSLKQAFTVSGLCRLLSRLFQDRRGGVLLIVGLSLVPLTFAVGFGVDYARALSLQTKLNAIADAAALAAVDPSMILQSDPMASTAAMGMFNAQANLLGGYQNLTVTAPVTDSTTTGSGATGYLRQVTVSYTAYSINVFGGLLGAATLKISGSSTANAQQPPNVDFYLAMDNSPSMLIPATQTGITSIQGVTSCAFACHEQLPHNDGIYVKNSNGLYVLLSTSYYTSGAATQNVYYFYDPSAKVLYNSSMGAMNSSSNNTTTTYSVTDSSSGPVTITKTVKTSGRNGDTSSSTYDTGYWADGYWLTHNYTTLYSSGSAITLRKDDVVSAASQLIPFAVSQAQNYQVTYQAQMFSFDWTRPNSSSPVKTLDNLTNVNSYVSSFSASSLFPADDYWWVNNMPTSSTSNADEGTEMTNMLTVMNNTIPTPGTGAPGATPQKILFIVTDGMLDQPNGGGRYFGPLRTSDLAGCATIKQRGIKIAILYTQYLPQALVGDSWSQSNVAPFLPAPPSPYPAGNAGSSDQVLTALQSCASPGINGTPLVQTVTANDNIALALQSLFSTALQSARLVQ